MLSKNTHYVDKTVDYAVLMVARTSPQCATLVLEMLVKHDFVPTPA